AIELARKGHKIGVRQGLVLSWVWDKLKRDAATGAIYSKNSKEPLKAGDLWKQPDLASTLDAIAQNGPKGFYEGAVAEKIENAMRAHGGRVTRDDLKGYVAKEREPLRFAYRGFVVYTMPPPSMGGIAFADI